jgi:hypothetical protein
MRIDPLRAWKPYPAMGSIVDVRTATPMTWSTGNSASKHAVYFDVNEAAVAGADAANTSGIYRGQVNTASFTPAESLEWGRKYFWRVDEINADGTVTKGKVWTFSVADYLLVDNFESYTNDSPDRVFQTMGGRRTFGGWYFPQPPEQRQCRRRLRHLEPDSPYCNESWAGESSQRLAGDADGLQQYHLPVPLRGGADLDDGPELAAQRRQHARAALRGEPTNSRR